MNGGTFDLLFRGYAHQAFYKVTITSVISMASVRSEGLTSV
jgi:hypothetical protein